MPIIEIIPYDLQTADAARFMAPVGFWASLARYARTGTARLLMIADNLRPADIEAGFRDCALPEETQPREVRMYRQQYLDHLAATTQTTRLMKLYLLLDSGLDAARLAQLLASYGLRARPLVGRGVPIPFASGTTTRLDRLQSEGGARWALLESGMQQSGALVPGALHRLFTLDFPVWCALDIYTYPAGRATQLLRTKDAAARYERGDSTQVQGAARAVRQAVGDFQTEIARAGAALHTVRLQVLVGADDEKTLQQRLEIARGSAPLAMLGRESAATRIERLFSPAPPARTDGALMSSVGLTILASSAMSYRRRGETRGVALGTDRHMAPVILDLFDDRQPSYNVVVLGQTGFGKTFAILLLMLRHLLLGKRLIILDPQGNIDLAWLGASSHRATIGTAGAAINILDIVDEELSTQVEMVIARLGLLGVVEPRAALERAVMDGVLVDLYAPLWGRDIPPSQMPTLRAVQARLDQLAGDHAQGEVRQLASRLSLKLEPYVTGSSAALFGRPTTVDLSLDHLVTLFDLAGLPRGEHANLRTALLSVLVGNIERAIRRRRAAGDEMPIMFFVDEIGVLMRDEVIAAFVSEQFKTARSRGVSMIVADQELTSLAGTADRRGMRHGRMMLATATTRLIFQQTGGDLPLLREAFPELPDDLLNSLPMLPRGTCVAQLPDDLLVVDVLPSPFEARMLSSRIQDRPLARQLMQRLADEAAGSVGALERWNGGALERWNDGTGSQAPASGNRHVPPDPACVGDPALERSSLPTGSPTTTCADAPQGPVRSRAKQ